MTDGGRAEVWDPPSPRVAELIQTTVRGLMDQPAELLALLDEVVIESNRKLLDLDPRLLDPLRAAARSNVTHWATANLGAPGQPVAPNLGPENTDFAREVVRHGFDETILAGFRAGQNVVIEYFTEMAFALTSDPEELRELLQTTTRSIFRYVDGTLAALVEIIGDERHRLRTVLHAGRLEAVSLILEGAPIAVRRASERLAYSVERTHTAAVLWADQEVDAGTLEEVAHELARQVGAERPLVLPVGTGAVWLWMAGGQLQDALTIPTGTFAALGRPGRGIGGFRASHLEALSVQRLVRRQQDPSPVTTFEDVELLALVSHDETRAHEFVTRTLGNLLDAPAELRETVATYLRESCNTTRTAQVLFTHRNTVIARLDKARELLPEPLEGNILKVALALELAGIMPNHRS